MMLQPGSGNRLMDYGFIFLMTGALAADLASIERAVLADAQQRVQLDPAQLTIVRSEAVTWRDGSLGCPEPDRLYPQMLVRGYRIRVQAGAALLDYHASAAGQWLWCPPGRAREPLPDDAK